MSRIFFQKLEEFFEKHKVSLTTYVLEIVTGKRPKKPGVDDNE